MPHPPDGLLLGHGRHDLLLRVTRRMNQEQVTPPRKPVLRTRQRRLEQAKPQRREGDRRWPRGQGGRGERSEG